MPKTLAQLIEETNGVQDTTSSPKTLTQLVEETTANDPVLPTPNIGGLASGFNRPQPVPIDPAETFAKNVMMRMGPQMGIGQFSGGTAGSIIAPLIAGRFIPGPVDDALLWSAPLRQLAPRLVGAGARAATPVAGAAAGGLAGEVAQQAVTGEWEPSKWGAAAVAEGLAEAGSRTAGAAVRGLAGKFVSKKAIQKFSEGFLGSSTKPADAGREIYALVGRRVSKELDPQDVARFAAGGATAADDFAQYQLHQGVVHQSLNEFFTPWKARINAATAQGAGVRIDSLKKVAQNAIDAHTRGARVLNPSDLRELKTIAAMKNDVVPFDWIEGHKTWWQSRNAKLTRDAKVSDTGMLDLANEAKRLQTDSASWVGVPPEVEPDIKAFNVAYSQSKDLMNTYLPRKLTEAIKKDPEKALDLIGDLPTGADRGLWLTRARETKRALTTLPDGSVIPGGSAAWDNLTQAWWTAKIQRYAKSGNFDTKGFSEMLHMLGDEGTKELVKPGDLGRFRQLTDMIQKKNATVLNQGTLLGTVGVAGGVGAGLGWDIYHDAQNGDYIGVMKDGGIAISAGMLASGARNPLVARAISSVLSHPKMAKEAVPDMARLVRLVRGIAAKRDATQKYEAETATRDAGIRQWGAGLSQRQGSSGRPIGVE